MASHPVALRQCRGFFAQHPVLEPVEYFDTAGAVRDLLRGDLAADAVIASAYAARLYGAMLLTEGIEDAGDNRTRFVIIGRR